MLFPSEWYRHIPAGYMVEVISGEVRPFRPGLDDDDIRCGCLAYGILAIDGEVVLEEDEAH